MKLLLKRLRHLSREGIPTELDLDDTIRKTSENAGMLDISLVPSKQNRVKVLILMDIGGSMDDHIELCAQLFSAPSTNSNIWNISTFIIAYTNRYGKTMFVVSSRESLLWN